MSGSSAVARPDDERDCELDEEFLQRLNGTLERHDLDECWLSSGRGKWRARASELAKWVWYLGGVFSRIDLFGGHQEEPSNRHYRRWSHHENFDRRFTRARLLWWPYVSLPLYAISSLRLAINIYYQYVYDFNFIRQQVFLALTSWTNTADVSSWLKSHWDSPFVQTILTCQERMVTAALAHGRQAQGAPTLLNFSSSMANASNRQRSERPNQRHLPTGLDELGALLAARVATAHATLKRIGAPYIVMTFEVQIVYFFLLASSFVLVVLIHLYYRHYQPFDYSLVRAVLDFKHERRLFNRLIVRELDRFIRSSRNFTLACVGQSRWFAGRTRCAGGGDRSKTATRGMSLEKAHARADANRFLLDHALTGRQLQQMALAGQLLPEHRTARWVDSVSLKFVGFAVGSMAYIFMAALFFAFIYFALSERLAIDAASYTDVLTICEAGVLVALIVPNGVIQIAVMVATCMDQIHYATSVCRRIRECIQVNQVRFAAICDAQFERQNFGPHHEQSSSYGRPIDGRKRALMMRSLLSFSTSSMANPSFQPPEECRASAEKRRASCMGAESEDRFGLFTDDSAGGPNRTRAMQQQQQQQVVDAPNQTLNHSLDVGSRCTQMNADLLRAFITYKIFVVQMRQTTRAFVTFTLACIALIIISPLMVRIHSPYFSQFTKLMSMMFSLLGTTAVDSCLILLCYMFARCTEIYRSLSSLLAHAVEVMNHAPGSLRSSLARDSWPATRSRLSSEKHPANHHVHRMRQQLQQRQIYDAHTIWLLRKELSFPDRVVSQFAIVALDFRLTYGNLLKIHFWLGLLTLSIFVDGASNQEFFGRLFHDPFGVFDWP